MARSLTLHWSQNFVGLRVTPEFDCAALAQQIQVQVFGKEVHLPQERPDGGVLERFRGRMQQIMEGKDAFVERVDSPRDGDAILLQTRGYRQHIGTYCLINGEPWVLHADDRAKQVVLQRIRDLAIRGIFVEGYYRWK